jgi:Skp family chaperone for outer membrane proteins
MALTSRMLTRHLKLGVMGAIAMFALVGCANRGGPGGAQPTAAQEQFDRVRSGVQNAHATWAKCAQAMVDAPELAILQRHQPFKIDDLTLAQMSDTAKVTPAEAKLLSLRYEAVVRCRKQRDIILAPVDAAVVSIHGDYETKADRDLVNLIQRKMTWGEYVTHAKQYVTEREAKLQARGEQVATSLRAADQTERAERQRQQEQQAQYYQQQQLIQQQQQYQQQLIDQVNRPIQTSCNRLGSYTNCTTQ